jgi:hypothetical protein
LGRAGGDRIHKRFQCQDAAKQFVIVQGNLLCSLVLDEVVGLLSYTREIPVYLPVRDSVSHEMAMVNGIGFLLEKGIL